MTSLRSGVKIGLMKKLKFKNDCLSFKKFNQIIFEDKKYRQIYRGIITSSGERDYPGPPTKWSYNEIKFKKNEYSSRGRNGTEAISYYKGKIKKKKRCGYGVEIVTQMGNYLPDVVSFYKGSWNNNKKNGKGFWSNHHPLIGVTTSVAVDNPRYVVSLGAGESSLKGEWKNNEIHQGTLEFSQGIYVGSFKKEKMYDGYLTFWDYDFIWEKAKNKISKIKMEVKKGKFMVTNEIRAFHKKHNIFLNDDERFFSLE